MKRQVSVTAQVISGQIYCDENFATLAEMGKRLRIKLPEGAIPWIESPEKYVVHFPDKVVVMEGVSFSMGGDPRTNPCLGAVVFLLDKATPYEPDPVRRRLVEQNRNGALAYLADPDSLRKLLHPETLRKLFRYVGSHADESGPELQVNIAGMITLIYRYEDYRLHVELIPNDPTLVMWTKLNKDDEVVEAGDEHLR